MARGIAVTTYLAGKVDTYMISGKTGKAIHPWRDRTISVADAHRPDCFPVAGARIAPLPATRRRRRQGSQSGS